MAISAALQDAIACTVCNWSCTKNHLGTVTSARPGLHAHNVRQDREVGDSCRRGHREQAGAAGAAGKRFPCSIGAAGTGHDDNLMTLMTQGRVRSSMCWLPGYGPTVMGSDAVGLAPTGALVVMLVIVTSTADAPWLTVKFWFGLSCS
jgi:hypothetical protein